MNSNRVASLTSATCSLRFGEALINLVPQVGEFLLHGPFAILPQIHDLEACYPDVYDLHTHGGPALGLDWPIGQSRYSFDVFLEFRQRTNQKSALFFGGKTKILGGN